jgi:NADH:ubiquinone oxidoreductase subunit 6 (subunit J)
MNILDAIPLWLVLVGTVFAVVVVVEIGFRVGIFRARRSEHEREAPMDAMVGSTLGLLAFVLAFTFGMATSRYDARRQLVLDDMMAIRTVDQRAQLLPEPHHSEIRVLLQEYVDVRLKGVLEPEELPRALKRTEELQDQLWSHAEPLVREVPAVAGPYTQAVLQMIDLHSKRVTAAVSNRIPGAIWIALYCLMALAMGIAGYREGIAGRRSLIATVAMTVAFSAVITLIADLDRPQEGFLKVSQEAMLDLQRRLDRE